MTYSGYSDWSPSMSGQDIINYLIQITKNPKLQNPIPCVITMNPEFYSRIEKRNKEGVDIDYTGINVRLLPKLPIPWRAYYSWEVFELDRVKYE